MIFSRLSIVILYLLLVSHIVCLTSCCKDDEKFEFIKTDSAGNVLVGDTSNAYLKQDAVLDWRSDSISSQALYLKNPKLRGCNNNIKIYLYPNPVKSNEKLFMKIISDKPVYSYAYANSQNGSSTVSDLGYSKTNIVVDITYDKPIIKRSNFEFYLATIDSCVYRGSSNLVVE